MEDALVTAIGLAGLGLAALCYHLARKLKAVRRDLQALQLREWEPGTVIRQGNRIHHHAFNEWCSQEVQDGVVYSVYRCATCGDHEKRVEGKAR